MSQIRLRTEDVAETGVIVSYGMCVLTRHKDDASKSENNHKSKEMSDTHNLPRRIYSLFTQEVDSMITLQVIRPEFYSHFCDYDCDSNRFYIKYISTSSI